jgi:hypothetical protein
VRPAAVLLLVAVTALGSGGCSLFGGRAPDPTGVRARRAAPEARTSGAKEAPGTVAVDRVVVRWHSPETGGVEKPQFILARELAFEARLEALADPDPDGASYRDRHVRAALDRHVAEVLLSSLPTLPEPKPVEVAARAQGAWAMLEQRVGGRERLLEAALAEGIDLEELNAMLRRQAKASIYLDRMIAPMLEPTEPELLALHRSGQTPFSAQPFEEIKERIKRWYVAAKLSQALDTYFQNARQRVTIVSVKKP